MRRYTGSRRSDGGQGGTFGAGFTRLIPAGGLTGAGGGEGGGATGGSSLITAGEEGCVTQGAGGGEVTAGAGGAGLGAAPFDLARAFRGGWVREIPDGGAGAGADAEV